MHWGRRGRVAGQGPMGEGAEEKLMSVSRKEAGDWLRRGESPEGRLSCPRWGAWGCIRGGLAGAEGVSCLCRLLVSAEEETDLSIGRRTRSAAVPWVQDLQSWLAPRGHQDGGRFGPRGARGLRLRNKLCPGRAPVFLLGCPDSPPVAPCPKRLPQGRGPCSRSVPAWPSARACSIRSLRGKWAHFPSTLWARRVPRSGGLPLPPIPHPVSSTRGRDEA